MQSLRDLRIRKLMSQQALALAAGVAPATIGQAELGRQTPRLLSMRRICNALEVEPEDVTEFAGALEDRTRGGVMTKKQIAYRTEGPISDIELRFTGSIYDKDYREGGTIPPTSQPPKPKSPPSPSYPPQE